MTTPDLNIPAGPGSFVAGDGVAPDGAWDAADVSLDLEWFDGSGDTAALITLDAVDVGGGRSMHICQELTAGDVDLIGAFANGRWTCAAGHPTTPPIEFEGGMYRLCPACQRDFEAGARDDSGVIVYTKEEA